MGLWFLAGGLNGQTNRVIDVIGVEEGYATISAGSHAGISTGDSFRFTRSIGGRITEIARGEASQVQYSRSRVRITQKSGAESLRIGDRAEPVTPPSAQTSPSRPAASSNAAAQNSRTTTAPSGTTARQSAQSPARTSSQTVNRPSGGEETYSAPAREASSGGISIRPVPRTETRVKNVYLGPIAGVFVPQGDMRDVFDVQIGYGGTVGLQFRPDLDVSARFFFVTKEDWSFWNLQMVGRKYFTQNVLWDLGYGVAYPQASGFDGSGLIRLGFLTGIGFTVQAGLDTWLELECLYHYYPNFGDKAGQFITVQAGLIL
jgi:hypothetical protein